MAAVAELANDVGTAPLAGSVYAARLLLPDG